MVNSFNVMFILCAKNEVKAERGREWSVDLFARGCLDRVSETKSPSQHKSYTAEADSEDQSQQIEQGRSWETYLPGNALIACQKQSLRASVCQSLCICDLVSATMLVDLLAWGCSDCVSETKPQSRQEHLTAEAYSKNRSQQMERSRSCVIYSLG